MTTVLQNIFPGVSRPVIGMVHLQALPGAPGYRGDLQAVRAAALADARALAQGGVDGLMLENLGDCPFFAQAVPPAVVAHMTALAVAVRQEVDLPMGINVLRNDGRSALAVAQACGAQWIRVNVLCAARLTDQGIVQGIAAELMRDRAALGAGHVAVWADVQVKHSADLAPMPLDQQVADLTERGRADALIVSGPGTGRPTDRRHLQAVRKAAAGACPVLVGSGLNAQNIAELAGLADGFIIGSAFKRDGRATGPVEQARVQALLEQLKR